MTDGVSDDVINIDDVTGVRQCLDECSNLKRSGNISLSGIDAVTTHAYRQVQSLCRCLIGFKQFVWTKYHSFFFNGRLFFFIVYFLSLLFFIVIIFIVTFLSLLLLSLLFLIDIDLSFKFYRYFSFSLVCFISLLFFIVYFFIVAFLSLLFYRSFLNRYWFIVQVLSLLFYRYFSFSLVCFISLLFFFVTFLCCYYFIYIYIYIWEITEKLLLSFVFNSEVKPARLGDDTERYS